MLKKIEKQMDNSGMEIRTDTNGKEYSIFYDAIGNEYHEYLQPLPLPQKKKKKEINLDDALLNYDGNPFPEEYYKYSWNEEPIAEDEEKIKTRSDFLKMDFKECQYHIYKQLLEISSSLSDIKEVLSDENKTK